MHLAALENSIFEEERKTDRIFKNHHTLGNIDGNFVFRRIEDVHATSLKKPDYLDCGSSHEQTVVMCFGCCAIDRVAATKEVDQPWFGEISQIRR